MGINFVTLQYILEAQLKPTYMKLTKRLLLLISFALLTGLQIHAQKIDSILNIYSEQFQPEKLHIHFDKAVYNASDTIWFKTYILAGTELSALSTNFYADWFDENGNLLKHTVSPITESTAKGQFEIPNNYNGRNIFVKAYTQWMLNFDNDFLYSKSIPVAQQSMVSKKNVDHKTTIQFFPEGGDLVNGLTSKLAFKAVDESGLPVEITGTIQNNTGELIDSFSSEHDGMGSLSIEPRNNETYTAVWVDAFGKTYTSDLPSAKSGGLVLQIIPSPEKDLIIIKRTNNVAESLKTLYMLASMNQHPVFSTKFDLFTKTTISSTIATSNLPTGILQITLFDANWIPIAERIVFVNNHEYVFTTDINIPLKGLDKREKNILEISVPENATSSLSVAVTDFDVSNNNNNTIITQLLLCSDLKGYIHNPTYYFSGDDDVIDEHLDLVMLTHGWRRYHWDDIVKEKLPVFLFPADTSFISLKGKITNYSNLKIPADQRITVMTQSKDNKQQVFYLPIQADGSFHQPSISFFDSIKVFYQFSRDNKLNEKAVINLNTSLLQKNIIFNSKDYYSASLDSNILVQSLLYGIEQNIIKQNRKKTTLPNVTVKGKTKTKLDLLDEEYASAKFRGDGYRYDVQNDPRIINGLTDVFHFLEGKLPIRFSYDQFGAPKNANWRMKTVDVYLNEAYVPFDELGSISIKDIAYIKVFEPGTPIGSGNPNHVGGSPGGVIAMYTNSGGSTNSDVLVKKAMLQGYTAYKEFYSPDYSAPINDFIKDARATVYWNPSVSTNVNSHKVKLVFYNNDFSKKLKVIVEGINDEGRLTRVEKIIE